MNRSLCHSVLVCLSAVLLCACSLPKRTIEVSRHSAVEILGSPPVQSVPTLDVVASPLPLPSNPYDNLNAQPFEKSVDIVHDQESQAEASELLDRFEEKKDGEVELLSSINNPQDFEISNRQGEKQESKDASNNMENIDEERGVLLEPDMPQNAAVHVPYDLTFFEHERPHVELSEGSVIEKADMESISLLGSTEQNQVMVKSPEAAVMSSGEVVTPAHEKLLNMRSEVEESDLINEESQLKVVGSDMPGPIVSVLDVPSVAETQNVEALSQGKKNESQNAVLADLEETIPAVVQMNAGKLKVRKTEESVASLDEQEVDLKPTILEEAQGVTLQDHDPVDSFDGEEKSNVLTREFEDNSQGAMVDELESQPLRDKLVEEDQLKILQQDVFKSTLIPQGSSELLDEPVKENVPKGTDENIEEVVVLDLEQSKSSNVQVEKVGSTKAEDVVLQAGPTQLDALVFFDEKKEVELAPLEEHVQEAVLAELDSLGSLERQVESDQLTRQEVETHKAKLAERKHPDSLDLLGERSEPVTQDDAESTELAQAVPLGLDVQENRLSPNEEIDQVNINPNRESPVLAAEEEKEFPVLERNASEIGEEKVFPPVQAQENVLSPDLVTRPLPRVDSNEWPRKSDRRKFSPEVVEASPMWNSLPPATTAQTQSVSENVRNIQSLDFKMTAKKAKTHSIECSRGREQLKQNRFQEGFLEFSQQIEASLKQNVVAQDRDESFSEKPELQDCYRQRAYALMQLKQFRPALWDMDHILQEEYSDVAQRSRDLFFRGRIYVLMGISGKAIIDFTEALRLGIEPKDKAHAYYLRGVSYIRTKRIPEGLNDVGKGCHLGYFQACEVLDKMY